MNTNQENQQIETVKRDISAQVLSKIEVFKSTGELKIPSDYSPENALKAAYLVLSEQKAGPDKNQPVLDYCTKESIANALLKMVVWGLSPLKKQVSFIPYGNKLECSIEYPGNIALAKRYANLKDVTAQVVLEGDEFEFGIDTTTGRKKIIKHNQSLQSLAKNVVKGAYAVLHLPDGTFDTEIMSIEMIIKSWQQGSMNGNSPAHKNFPDQMAKKTVINRATKLLIRSSDDSILFSDDNDDNGVHAQTENVQHEINSNANRKPIDFEDADFEDVDDDNQENINKTGKPQQNLGPDF